MLFHCHVGFLRVYLAETAKTNHYKETCDRRKSWHLPQRNQRKQTANEKRFEKSKLNHREDLLGSGCYIVGVLIWWECLNWFGRCSSSDVSLVYKGHMRAQNPRRLLYNQCLLTSLTIYPADSIKIKPLLGDGFHQNFGDLTKSSQDVCLIIFFLWVWRTFRHAPSLDDLPATVPWNGYCLHSLPFLNHESPSKKQFQGANPQHAATVSESLIFPLYAWETCMVLSMLLGTIRATATNHRKRQPNPGIWPFKMNQHFQVVAGFLLPFFFLSPQNNLRFAGLWKLSVNRITISSFKYTKH